MVTVSEYTEVTLGVAVGFATVVDDKDGPLHAYVAVLPPGLAVSVTVPPLQIGPLLVGAAVGVAFTVTEVVYTVAGEHPGCVEPSVTVSEYTLVTVGVAVGLATTDDDNDEPLQLYVVAPSAPLAVNVTVPPLQIGPLLDGAAVGVALTVTEVVYTVAGEHPASAVPSLTVSEYTVDDVGVAVGFSVLVADNDEPLQV